uniref:Mitochondrial ribosomal protein S24 n=1 Tax=Varanus komodoensis TaxID=61221 RepID=A0A8D2JJE8_VARKO
MAAPWWPEARRGLQVSAFRPGRAARRGRAQGSGRRQEGRRPASAEPSAAGGPAAAAPNGVSLAGLRREARRRRLAALRAAGFPDQQRLFQGNLHGEDGAAERTVEDLFIRKFIYGTFHGCLANEIVLKRRANVLIICAIFVQRLSPSKFYFLIGYTETLLSFLYKCPVKMEVQTVPTKVVYKYL